MSSVPRTCSPFMPPGGISYCLLLGIAPGLKVSMNFRSLLAIDIVPLAILQHQVFPVVQNKKHSFTPLHAVGPLFFLLTPPRSRRICYCPQDGPAGSLSATMRIITEFAKTRAISLSEQSSLRFASWSRVNSSPVRDVVIVPRLTRTSVIKCLFVLVSLLGSTD